MLLETLHARIAAGQDRVAICSSTQQITYAELDQRAVWIAQALQARCVREGALVAICMERSPALIVAVVGVLLAGAAYTVVETHAQDRYVGRYDAILETLRRIEPDLVLVERGDSGWCRGGYPSAVIPKRAYGWFAPLRALTGRAPSRAYVVFTSGTTGMSKGVEISHASLAHYCQAMVERLALPDGLRYAHVSTLAADLGNTSLFLALWTGGSVYLANDQERRDPQQLAVALAAQQVDCLKCTPTQWRLLSAVDCAGVSLQWLILGGERLSKPLAQETLATGRVRHLVNHYGPSEFTIGATVQPVTEALLATWEGEWVPIGSPLGQNSALIRPECGGKKWVAATAGTGNGELYLCGPGQALGYRDLPKETRQRFVVVGTPPRPAYRTGDWVRVDAQGLLHFIGRLDRQVKVNGYRVELEPVERQLRLAGASYTRVIHVRHGQRDVLLCAYEGAPELAAGLRQRLLRELPSYRVPAGYLAMNPLPTTENGKLDEAQIRERLVERFITHGSGEVEQSLEAEVQRLFRLYAPGSSPGLDDTFFAFGGDSLGAIQLITELQVQGYAISAHDFFDCPTVRGLTELLARHPCLTTPVAPVLEPGPWPCSPAQEAFFAQDLAEPNRWTQVLVMDMQYGLDEARLRQALAALTVAHPMLSAVFSPDAGGHGWCFCYNPAITPLLHVLPVRRASAQAMEQAVAQAYARIESQLDIRQGRVFGTALIQAPDHDVVLMVAHHLVVDVISWHLLQRALLRSYTEQLPNAVVSVPFGEWCRQLRQRLDRSPDVQALPALTEDAGGEGHSHSVWIRFSREETALLEQQTQALGVRDLDRLLLAAYARACATLSGHAQVQIDVETHGRWEVARGGDVCGTVGWFTLTGTIVLQPADDPGDGLPQRVQEALRAWSPSAPKQVPPGVSAAPYCFNYIGASPWCDLPAMTWIPMSVTLPSLRGARNRRSHLLRLTARVLDQQLVIDINYPAPRYDALVMCRFARELRGHLVAPADRLAWDRYQPLAATANSAGVLWSVPMGLLDAPTESALIAPPSGCVLLTGATGFLGIHLLHALLQQQASTTVVCLLRGQAGLSAAERLHAAWTRFFPDSGFPQQRVQVLEATMERPRWGVSKGDWTRLADEVDAIYHLAADTHLVGDTPDTVTRALVPLQQLLALAAQGRSKTVHFASTLAIADTCATPQRFGEDSYNIGQTFLNGYERAKYEAEGVLRRFAQNGGRMCIYRCGTITGQSDSGRFQRNASDSRWVQSLRALLRIGQVPAHYDEPLCWTAVDEVAQAMAALSLERALVGSTFHLEAETRLSMAQVLAALARCGVELEPVAAGSLQALFQQSERRLEPDVALGHFWASRPPRNVQFDHRHTVTLLAGKDFHFSALDDAWVERFLEHLFVTGALPRTSATKPMQGDPS
ncbi:AMP-binding protein [Pseudomonas helleri]|uniref:AMP-binding protein n=1 Tax=Pseudomonas helleri TaxID=1608996 RepID=UPI002430A7EB|nr:AMP-binding protein [Pseudomonas helleri]